MRECAQKCWRAQKACEEKDCRLFIEFPADNNCTLIASGKHGPMTLEQIGKRHHISTVRAKQILDATLLKLKKTLLRSNTI